MTHAARTHTTTNRRHGSTAMRSKLAAAILLAAAALAGCGGISDPYNDPQARTDAAQTGTTDATGATVPAATDEPPAIERGIGEPAPDLSGALDRAVMSSSAAETIERFSDLTGTWTWRDIAAKLREAARISIGAASERNMTTALQIPAATTYQTRGVRQTTRIEAIVPREGATDTEASYLVVQRRRIEMIDATPSNQWFVSLATLRRVDGRWAVSAWEELV